MTLGKTGGTIILTIGAIIMIYFGFDVVAVIASHDYTGKELYLSAFWITLGAILVVIGYWYRSKEKRMIAKQSKGWDK
jgi:hypothetical protein